MPIVGVLDYIVECDNGKRCPIELLLGYKIHYHFLVKIVLQPIYSQT